MAEQHLDHADIGVLLEQVGTAERSEWCAININKRAWTLYLRANGRFAPEAVVRGTREAIDLCQFSAF
jgi:hypothetical protein